MVVLANIRPKINKASTWEGSSVLYLVIVLFLKILIQMNSDYNIL